MMAVTSRAAVAFVFLSLGCDPPGEGGSARPVDLSGDIGPAGGGDAGVAPSPDDEAECGHVIASSRAAVTASSAEARWAARRWTVSPAAVSTACTAAVAASATRASAASVAAAAACSMAPRSASPAASSACLADS